MKGKAHIVGSVVVLVVVAALAVAPTGLAAAGYSPDAFERAVNAHNASLPNPDAFERAVNIRLASLGTSGELARNDAVHGRAASPGTVTATQSVSSEDAFDWNAAAIGGSATLALVLLVGTIVVATRQVRHRAVAH